MPEDESVRKHNRHEIGITSFTCPRGAGGFSETDRIQDRRSTGHTGHTDPFLVNTYFPFMAA